MTSEAEFNAALPAHIQEWARASGTTGNWLVAYNIHHGRDPWAEPDGGAALWDTEPVFSYGDVVTAAPVAEAPAADEGARTFLNGSWYRAFLDGRFVLDSDQSGPAQIVSEDATTRTFDDGIILHKDMSGVVSQEYAVGPVVDEAFSLSRTGVPLAVREAVEEAKDGAEQTRETYGSGREAGQLLASPFTGGSGGDGPVLDGLSLALGRPVAEGLAGAFAQGWGIAFPKVDFAGNVHENHARALGANLALGATFATGVLAGVTEEVGVGVVHTFLPPLSADERHTLEVEIPRGRRGIPTFRERVEDRFHSLLGPSPLPSADPGEDYLSDIRAPPRRASPGEANEENTGIPGKVGGVAVDLGDYPDEQERDSQDGLPHVPGVKLPWLEPFIAGSGAPLAFAGAAVAAPVTGDGMLLSTTNFPGVTVGGLVQQVGGFIEEHPVATGLGAVALAAGAVGAADLARGDGSAIRGAVARVSSGRRSSRRSSSRSRRSSKRGARKPLRRAKKAKAKAPAKKRRREDRTGVTRGTYRGQKVYRTKNGRPYVILKSGPMKGMARFVPQ